MRVACFNNKHQETTLLLSKTGFQYSGFLVTVYLSGLLRSIFYCKKGPLNKSFRICRYFKELTHNPFYYRPAVNNGRVFEKALRFEMRPTQRASRLVRIFGWDRRFCRGILLIGFCLHSANLVGLLSSSSGSISELFFR